VTSSQFILSLGLLLAKLLFYFIWGVYVLLECILYKQFDNLCKNKPAPFLFQICEEVNNFKGFGRVICKIIALAYALCVS